MRFEVDPRRARSGTSRTHVPASERGAGRYGSVASDALDASSASLRATRSRATAALVCLAFASCVSLAACERGGRAPTPAPPASQADQAPWPAFAGAAACAPCHASIAAKWDASPHGRHGRPVATPAEASDGAVGGRWMQAFLRRGADGYRRILPQCYEVAAKAWRSVPAVLDEIGGAWPGHPTGLPPLAARSFEADCSGCHASQPWRRYDLATGRMESGEIDVAINCETCHGPGRAHAASWGRLVPGERMHDLAKDSPRVASAACGRCHGGPSTVGDYAPGDAPSFVTSLQDRPGFFPDGRASGQVYQYPGLVRSACHVKGGITCSSCHDPHGPGLRPFGGTDAMCTRCHAEKSSRAHTFHDPRGDGARCIECHMPRLRTGLLAAQRDHTLGVPIPAVAEVPDACTACHRDRTKAWADAAWRERWGEPPRATIDAVRGIVLARENDPAAVPLLRGALSHRDAFFRGNAALYLSDPTSVLDDPSPEVRLLAVSAAARSAEPAAALERLAADREPFVRAMALLASHRAGAPLPPNAASDLRVAVRQATILPETRLLLAWAEKARGDAGAAASAVLDAISCDPTLLARWENLAAVLDDLGRPAEAEAVRARAARASGDAPRKGP